MFNGSIAVVKQCAEVILIRLGQSDDKMSPAPPSFSSKIQRTISASTQLNTKKSAKSVVF